jgi:hypothetical protein
MNQLPPLDRELLERMGLRIEGPGDAALGERLTDRFWWTWYRDGWGGIECGPAFATPEAAEEHAWRSLWTDADLADELAAESARPTHRVERTDHPSSGQF